VRIARATQKARFAAGAPAYLRGSIASAAAREEVRRRLASREESFLRVVDGLMLQNGRAPYRELLAGAGWDRARLERSVSRDGVEGTLESLRDDGVWISAGELRGSEAIERVGVRLHPRAADFDNPVHMGRAIRGTTSGTGGAPARVAYDWSMFAEEASLESLLFESHGLLDRPWAMWLPALPAMAGVHNLLVHARMRQPPERWFSHAPARAADRAMLRCLRALARADGMDLPAPEHLRPAEAAVVARWLAAARDRAGRAALKTFSSSALRVAESARRMGIELEGCVLLAGGEPLSERRRSFIESTGARVFGRYVATETGWIAGACGMQADDRMHLYSDRLAVVEGDPAPSGGRRLLVTTLSPTSGKLLLNADIGDSGVLGVGSCPCALGSAGLNHHLAEVRPRDRLVGEGMSVPAATLGAILDDAIADAGGAPDGWQIAETEDGAGRSRVVINVGGSVPMSEQELVSRVLDRLPHAGPGYRLAADAWRDAATLIVRREEPDFTPAFKMPPVAPARRLEPDTWARIYDGHPVDGQSLVFRRGAEIALRLCVEGAQPGERWLDVGCGSGHLAKALSLHGLDVIGLDSDPRMVEAAASRFGAKETPGGLRFAVGRAEALPFDDGELDGIVATSLMGCVRSPAAVAAEARRALRVGGTAVITFTNRASALHRAPSWIRPERSASDALVLPDVRLFGGDEVLGICEDAGLEVLRVRYYNFFLDTRAGLLPPRAIALALERALPRKAGSLIGRNLIVMARNPG
jgi:SAM-dependent methyltransferase